VRASSSCAAGRALGWAALALACSSAEGQQRRVLADDPVDEAACEAALAVEDARVRAAIETADEERRIRLRTLRASARRARAERRIDLLDGARSPEIAAVITAIRATERACLPRTFGRPCHRARDCRRPTDRCQPIDSRGNPEPDDLRAFASICTTSCEGAACPAGWACTASERESLEPEGEDGYVLERESVRVCTPRPPGAWSVPFGGACRSDMDCAEDAPRCLTHGDRQLCTRPCSDDCPTGFACRASQSVLGSTIRGGWVCAPAAP
jgi:hypothetical protein